MCAVGPFYWDEDEDEGDYDVDPWVPAKRADEYTDDEIRALLPFTAMTDGKPGDVIIGEDEMIDLVRRMIEEYWREENEAVAA